MRLFANAAASALAAFSPSPLAPPSTPTPAVLPGARFGVASSLRLRGRNDSSASYVTMSMSTSDAAPDPDAEVLHVVGPKNIRWGILSAGKISSDFCRAIGLVDGAEVAAVAARDPASSSAFAKVHGIPKSYGRYGDLLSDPDVDVVYVGSVAQTHASLAADAIKAGKPVVVEKPLTTSLADTIELVELARERGVFLMEGMWTRCFPAMRKVRELVASGAIGDVVAVQGDFGWSTQSCPFPGDRIWDRDSGGMTLDIGMYLAQLGQVAFPSADVETVQAMGTMKHGVDHTVLANVMYRDRDVINPNGGEEVEGPRKGMLQFYVTGEANTEERVSIQGSRGRIIVDPPAHVPTVVRLYRDEGRGSSSEETFNFPLPDDSFAEWNYPGSVGFVYQVEEVSAALRQARTECEHFTLDDSLQVGLVMDEVLRQVHHGRVFDEANLAPATLVEERRDDEGARIETAANGQRTTGLR